MRIYKDEDIDLMEGNVVLWDICESIEDAEKKTELIRFTDMLERHGMTKIDVVLWHNYGNKYWILLPKDKTSGTHYRVRNFLFMEQCEIGDKYNDGENIHEVVRINRKEDYDYITCQRILKSGKLGKNKIRISHFSKKIN